MSVACTLSVDQKIGLLGHEKIFTASRAVAMAGNTEYRRNGDSLRKKITIEKFSIYAAVEVIWAMVAFLGKFSSI